MPSKQQGKVERAIRFLRSETQARSPVERVPLSHAWGVPTVPKNKEQGTLPDVAKRAG
jgi:hypothetical protein